MVRILLAERVPTDGRVLVVGAGGGLELEDMALAHPGWLFDGVDPSQPMLDLAVQRLQSAGVSGDRVALHHGYVQSAPAGPFDGATCLLTLHFVPREDRVPMAAEIRRRLKPGRRWWWRIWRGGWFRPRWRGRGRGARSVAVALCRVSGGVRRAAGACG